MPSSINSRSRSRSPRSEPMQETQTDLANRKLPFLPGNCFTDLNKAQFHKSQTLGYKNGYQVPVDLEMMSKSNEELTSEDVAKLLSISTMANAELTYGPARPKNDPVNNEQLEDKVVLRFYGYFKQTLHDSREPFLLRVVKILYYVEDDTIAVLEPSYPNSGIMQGALIKRQRIPRTSEEFFGASDLSVGANITFYAKTFHIYDCDNFTRNYMQEKHQIKMQGAEPCPVDPYVLARNQPLAHYLKHEHNDKLSRFLHQDRHVLRFYCEWMEERRKFVLHYYLVDDCVEVLEVHRPNDGRDPCPLLLKRQQLPRVYRNLSDIKEGAFYTWQDLQIGKTINVLNRHFKIFDCDEFTRKYYAEKLGLAMKAIKFQEEQQKTNERAYPPYTGFGTEEDSLQSCKSLVLQPPKKKFSLNQENIILRFVSKMDSRFPEDSGRRFIISVYTSDDTVSVYEPPQRNSGILGGKFAERAKVPLPTSSKAGIQYYKSPDFFIGARIAIHAYCFVLYDADEAVFSYMERNPGIYPFSCYNAAIAEVQNLKPHEIKRLVELLKEPKLEQRHFRDKLDINIHPHSLITIFRHKGQAISDLANTVA